MRILFATNTLQMGGIETNLVRLTEEFSARGHEVIAATGGGTLVRELERAGGSHREVTYSLNPLSFGRGVKGLREVIASLQPDVIHCFSASTQPAAWLACRSSNAKGRPPLITSIMGLKNSPDEAAMITYARAYLTIVGADKVVVIAPAIEALIERLSLRPRVALFPVVGLRVPEFVPDEAVRDSIRQELGQPEGDPVVMTMGNLEPRKSHELFIEAASRVLKRIPSARFLVIGGGPLKNSLQKQIDETGFADRIFLVDERLDGPRLIAAADVYVRPGVLEGFVGITVLEAQAVGVPVVSFETEDVKLAISDRSTGLLVKNGDVGQLADAIVTLLSDNTLSEAITQRAFERLKKTFSIEAVVSGLETLYQREIERRNAESETST